VAAADGKRHRFLIDWEGSMKLVYVVALHRSGSTVIAVITNSHPDLVSPGEMAEPSGRTGNEEGPVCSCGRRVAKCPFWIEVSRRYIAQGYPWAPASWHLGYRFEQHPLWSRLALGRPGPHAIRARVIELLPLVGNGLRELHKRNRAYAQCILDVSGKKALVDTSKYPERLAYWLRVPDVDASAVHLVRDPRGYCNSHRKLPGLPVELTSRQWVVRNQYIERLMGVLPPSKRMSLRYEDFCWDPQAAMDRIYRLAGFPSVPVPDDLRQISHHLLGNRMRTKGHPRVVEDCSWQKELSTEAIAVIEGTTGATARQYGYDI